MNKIVVEFECPRCNEKGAINEDGKVEGNNFAFESYAHIPIFRCLACDTTDSELAKQVIKEFNKKQEGKANE